MSRDHRRPEPRVPATTAGRHRVTINWSAAWASIRSTSTSVGASGQPSPHDGSAGRAALAERRRRGRLGERRAAATIPGPPRPRLAQIGDVAGPGGHSVLVRLSPRAASSRQWAPSPAVPACLPSQLGPLTRYGPRTQPVGVVHDRGSGRRAFAGPTSRQVQSSGQLDRTGSGRRRPAGGSTPTEAAPCVIATSPLEHDGADLPPPPGHPVDRSRTAPRCSWPGGSTRRCPLVHRETHPPIADDNDPVEADDRDVRRSRASSPDTTADRGNDGCADPRSSPWHSHRRPSVTATIRWADASSSVLHDCRAEAEHRHRVGSTARVSLPVLRQDQVGDHPVQPVWCEAPSPMPVSPSKYS